MSRSASARHAFAAICSGVSAETFFPGGLTVSTASSSALETTLPISGGKRAFNMNVPSMSKKDETWRCSCCNCASSAASRRCVQRYLRTSFSTCAAVPLRATCTSTDSFALVATRVIARTFEYEIAPFANASAISGSCSSARATRTFSRAATAPIPHCQFSHCAVFASPCRSYAFARSNSATSARKRAVAAFRNPHSSVIFASSSSNPRSLRRTSSSQAGAAQAMGDLRSIAG
jgi:hypothetical protein